MAGRCLRRKNKYIGTRIKLKRKPVTPRNPPMLFLMIAQIFSVRLGSCFSRLGSCFSTNSWRRPCSASVNLEGAGAISSNGGVADGEGIGRASSGAAVAVGFGLGFGIGAGVDPSNQFTIPLVAFARVLSVLPKVRS